MIEPATIAALQAGCEHLVVDAFRGDTRVVVPREQLSECLRLLRDRLGFDFLVDVTCVDYLHYRGAEHRFGLVYLLASTGSNERLTVRVYLDEPELRVASVVPLWAGANWLEREVYDLFGIEFEGHPDLRRILLPEEFMAHPLRKDYPLQGRGERHNFPVLRREVG
jgi:NADH-quinone oxidoreductase subunit C